MSEEGHKYTFGGFAPNSSYWKKKEQREGKAEGGANGDPYDEDILPDPHPVYVSDEWIESLQHIKVVEDPPLDWDNC